MKGALFKTLVINNSDKKKTPVPSPAKPVAKVGSRKGSVQADSNLLGAQQPGRRFQVVDNINEGTIMTRDMPFEKFTVKRAQVQYMSLEELTRLAVVVITNEDKDGVTMNTINDPRMGPVEPGDKCRHVQCLLTKKFCPGHLGRIELVEPIINRSAYDFVVRCLQSVCVKCGNLLLSPEFVESSKFSSGTARLMEIAKESESQYCRNPECKSFNAFNPKISTKPGKMTSIDIIGNGNVPGSLKTSQIVKIFDAIPPKDLLALGFKDEIGPNGKVVYKNHPNNFIFQNLPVIPECHRPKTMQSDGEPKDDELTKIYRRIVALNNTLKAAKLSGSTAGGKKSSDATIEDLDLLISSILSTSDEKSSANGPDTSDTVKGKLSKKKGYFRCFAMGKRGNRTGRSMIGSASIPFGYIRIPNEMANYVTITERVCDKNIRELSQLLTDGQIPFFVDNYRGLNDVKRKRNARLEIGNIVWRYLDNGDPIVFNRQPTLHKQSMMGYLVKKAPGKSIGIHSSNTTPHNADFDGDEGNVYVTPSYEARAEIMFIAGCWNNIVAPQFSRPVMGIVYNGVTASYLISMHGAFTPSVWERGMDTFGRFRDRIDGTPNFPGLLKRASQWYSEDVVRCGPVMFSALLPPDFYYSKDDVKIINGILINPSFKGILKKKHVGPSSGSIVHQLYHHYGTAVAARFISEAQILLDYFIEQRGFTVGYGDCSVEAEEQSRIKRIVNEKLNESRQKIADLGLPKPGMSDVELNFREESIQAALGNIKAIGDQIVKEGLDPMNNLRVMAVSGAKGSVSNIAQITGVIGQQFFMNKRPPLKYNVNKYSVGRRFLPYYDVEPVGADGDLLNRGFIDKNFGEGMRPGQFFAHMMDSRKGLIDTALGTATTGHMNRTINKTLEDVRLGYNGTVCKENGAVIQYLFGPDGYDPRALVETNNAATGPIWSPIDISTLVAKLNAEVDYPLRR